MGFFAVRDWSVAFKVFVAPAVALVALVVVTVAAIVSSKGLSSNLTKVGEQEIKAVVDSQAMVAQVARLHQQMYQVLVWQAVGQREERIKALQDEMLAAVAKLAKDLKAKQDLADLSDEQKQIFKSMAEGVDRYGKVARDTLDMMVAGIESAGTYIPALDVEFKGLTANVEKLVAMQLESTKSGVAQAHTKANSFVVGFLVLAVVAGVVSAWLAFWAVRSVTQPLKESIETLGKVAQGDLTVVVNANRGDEIGRLLKAIDHLRDALTGIVSNVRSNAQSVATASAEIAQGNQDLSRRTEQQAAELQRTASTMADLGQTVGHNADNAQQANQLAVGASDAAMRGGSVVTEVVQTMKGISQSSGKIAEIISVIDGIAFQTNILALNAAVEAARAGEQGRGFAVVASEVRSLAQRSSEAAREIKDLITSSVDQVAQGNTLVEQAGNSMQEIVSSIRRLGDLVGEISSASREQSQSVNQVSQAVNQIDQGTQQNAALVEEGAASADSLKAQAAQLVESVAMFKLDQNHDHNYSRSDVVRLGAY